MANQGAAQLFRFLLVGEPSERNIVRQVFRDDLLRLYFVNWEEVASDIVRRLHHDIACAPTDETLPKLLGEVLSYPNVPERWRSGELQVIKSPLLIFSLRKLEVELRFFPTYTTFAAPHDVTLEELRIESSFPADEHTAAVWSKPL